MNHACVQAVLEIHDEVAAQIQNCHEDFEYIDGVSSICEDDLESLLRETMGGRLSSLREDTDGERREEGGAGDKEEEEELEEIKVDTFRVIGVRRKKGECLVSRSEAQLPIYRHSSADCNKSFLNEQGLTVRLEHGKVTVARILIDSVIDRQGLVQTGDVILQVLVHE